MSQCLACTVAAHDSRAAAPRSAHFMVSPVFAVRLLQPACDVTQWYGSAWCNFTPAMLVVPSFISLSAGHLSITALPLVMGCQWIGSSQRSTAVGWWAVGVVHCLIFLFLWALDWRRPSRLCARPRLRSNHASVITYVWLLG